MSPEAAAQTCTQVRTLIEKVHFLSLFFFTIASFFSIEKKKHQTSNTFSLLPALLLLIMLLLSPSAGCNILEGTQSLFSETSFFTNLKLRKQSVNFPTLPLPGLCFLEVHVGLLFPKLRKKAEDPGQSYRYPYKIIRLEETFKIINLQSLWIKEQCARDFS